MEMRYYTTTVADDGSATVADLPPQTMVNIVVLYEETNDLSVELRSIADSLHDHPFMQMTKDEILAALRQTRDEVWEEQYGHLS